MTATRSNRSRNLDRALGAVFLIALATPGALALVHGEANVIRAGKIARRRPTPAPTIDSPTFARDFDAWFEDAWGGRETALRTNARIARSAFGTSPAGYLVFGRDGWIFSREARSFESFAGVDPLGPARLADWQRALEDRHDWLAARGIDHFVVLVPHKSSVYPDKLPRGVEDSRGTSRREEFLRWMAERSRVPVLDVAPALAEARVADGPWQHAYSPHGVHWTAVGGHAAYRQIVTRLAQSHGAPPPRPLADFEIVDQDGEGDSWASRMLLDGVIDMENLLLVPRWETGVVDGGAPPGGTRRDYAATRPNGSGPRVLMVHDSFGPDIRKLIAMHTSALEARWRPYLERGAVERMRPDVVIELYSELALVTQTPFRRAEFLGPSVRTAYDGASVARRLDLTQPLTFDAFPERVRTSSEGNAVSITVERGAGYLALGEVPAGSPGDEVFLGLRLRAETAGTIAVFVAGEFGRGPDAERLQPLEVSTDESLAILPLIAAEPGSKAWIVLPRTVGSVTLQSVEFRRTRGSAPGSPPR